MASFIKQYFCNHNWEEKYRVRTFEYPSSKYPCKINIILICTKCGKVFDFEYDFEYEKIKDAIEKQTGIEISDKGIALEGICDSCKNK